MEILATLQFWSELWECIWPWAFICWVAEVPFVWYFISLDKPISIN